jgi:hypothetical protein
MKSQTLTLAESNLLCAILDSAWIRADNSCHKGNAPLRCMIEEIMLKLQTSPAMDEIEWNNEQKYTLE